MESISMSLWENRQKLPDMCGGYKFEEHAPSQIYVITTKKSALAGSA